MSWVDNILFHCGATLELNCDPDTESHKTQVCRLCDIKYNVLLLREAFKETKYDEHFIFMQSIKLKAKQAAGF